MGAPDSDFQFGAHCQSVSITCWFSGTPTFRIREGLAVLRSSQQFGGGCGTQSREVAVIGDDPAAFGAAARTLDDAVGKVAAPRGHLQADLSGWAVDLDVASLKVR